MTAGISAHLGRLVGIVEAESELREEIAVSLTFLLVVPLILSLPFLNFWS